LPYYLEISIERHSNAKKKVKEEACVPAETGTQRLWNTSLGRYSYTTIFGTMGLIRPASLQAHIISRA
jgi:hypothetical protein